MSSANLSSQSLSEATMLLFSEQYDGGTTTFVTTGSDQNFDNLPNIASDSNPHGTSSDYDIKWTQFGDTGDEKGITNIFIYI